MPEETNPDEQEPRPRLSQTEAEDVLFASPTVIVTNRRVVFKTRSYNANAIASVKVQHGKPGRAKPRGPMRPLGIALALGGAAVGGAGAYTGWGMPLIVTFFVLIGILAFAAGAYVLGLSAAPKPDPTRRYSVRFATATGEKERVANLTEAEARKLADAISAATAGAPR